MEDSEHTEVTKLFGANLRRLRESRGWSQSELARQMQDVGWPKYSQVAVSRTEEGSRAVRLDEATDLARLLDATVVEMTTPPSSRVARIYELQRQTQAVEAAAKDLHEAAQKYERVRRFAWAMQRRIMTHTESKWASESLKAAFVDEMRSLTHVLEMDAVQLLEWVEDRQFEEDMEV